MLVTPRTLTNNGTLRAKAGSTLHLNLTKDPADIGVENRKHIIADGSDAKVRIASNIVQHENASIKTANGGVVLLEGTSILDGGLNGEFHVNSLFGRVILADVEIEQGSNISVPGGHSLRLSGNIINDGLIEIGDAGTNGATLILSAGLGAPFPGLFFIEGGGKFLMRNTRSSIEISSLTFSPEPPEAIVVNGEDHSIEGAGDIGSDDVLQVTNLGTIIANGQLNENGERTPGDLIITSDDQMLNRGTLTVVGNGNRLAVNGGGTETTLNNHGNVEIGPGAVMVIDGRYVAHGGGRTDNRGTMIAEQYLLSSSPDTGPHLFRGKGFVKGNVENNALVGPGDSPGTLTIEGDYGQNGLLEIELGGTTADSQYDVLAVTGLASFFEGSELQVQLIDAFGGDDPLQPELGDLFDVVHADTILDQGLVFDFPTLPGLRFAHEIIDIGSAQALRLTVIPEPATLPGDVNQDGVVDSADVTAFCDEFKIQDPGDVADVNGNGVVDLDDLDALLTELGTVRGDINLTEGAFDQLVDILDFGVLAGGFGQADPTYFDGDLNKDDRVDILDFDLLADNYGKTFTDLEANIIPEPGTSVVLELGGLMLLPQQRVKT